MFVTGENVHFHSLEQNYAKTSFSEQSLNGTSAHNRLFSAMEQFQQSSGKADLNWKV